MVVLLGRRISVLDACESQVVTADVKGDVQFQRSEFCTKRLFADAGTSASQYPWLGDFGKVLCPVEVWFEIVAFQFGISFLHPTGQWIERTVVDRFTLLPRRDRVLFAHAHLNG